MKTLNDAIEACAVIAEDHSDHMGGTHSGRLIAAKIRKLKTPEAKRPNMIFKPDINGNLPIIGQPPCQPSKARLIGHAPSHLTDEELVKYVAAFFPHKIMEAKHVKSKKRGDRWSLIFGA